MLVVQNSATAGNTSIANVQVRLRVTVNKNRYEIFDFLDRGTWATYGNGDC